MNNVHPMKPISLTPDYSGGEPPMSNLELRVGHLETDVSEIKSDLKDFRSETISEFKSLRSETASEFKSLRSETASEFKDAKKDIENLKTDVAVIKSNYATKQDVAEVKTEMHSLARQMVMWNIGSIFTAVGVVFALLRYLG